MVTKKLKTPSNFSLDQIKQMAQIRANGETIVNIAAQFKTSARTVGRCLDFLAQNGSEEKVYPAKESVKAMAKKAAGKKTDKKSEQDTINPVVDVAVKLEKATPKSNYIITPQSVVITHNSKTNTINKSHECFKEIVEAVMSGDYDKAVKLADKRVAINEYSDGALVVKGGRIKYGELEVSNKIVPKIFELMAEGDETFKNLVRFLERLLENPSKDSVDQLWGFVAHNDIAITDRGTLIGWKKVKQNGAGNLVDSYTGRVPNDVGVTVRMPRNMVNDNRHETCSQGLHVGAWDYVSKFGGNTILMVEVDPADVVSVPNDYNDMKMRAAKYRVLAIVDDNRRVLCDTPVDGNEKKEFVIGDHGEILKTVIHP